MTQDSIYKLLKKKDRWMTCKEISKCLKLSRSSVSSSLNRLFKHGDVLKKDIGSRFLGGFGFRPYQWRIK